MEIRYFQIFLTAAFAGLLLLVEHWAPWQGLLRKPLHPTANYILGTLAMHVPLTVLLIVWKAWEILIALWVTTVLGGLMVLGAYALDGWAAAKTKLVVSEHEAQTLRPGVNDEGQEAA